MKIIFILVLLLISTQCNSFKSSKEYFVFINKSDYEIDSLQIINEGIVIETFIEDFSQIDSNYNFSGDIIFNKINPIDVLVKLFYKDNSNFTDCFIFNCTDCGGTNIIEVYCDSIKYIYHN